MTLKNVFKNRKITLPTSRRSCPFGPKVLFSKEEKEKPIPCWTSMVATTPLRLNKISYLRTGKRFILWWLKIKNYSKLVVITHKVIHSVCNYVQFGRILRAWDYQIILAQKPESFGSMDNNLGRIKMCLPPF